MKAVIQPLPSVLTEDTVPYFTDPVQAGFPSPARDHMDSQLDFNELLIKRPASTYVLRAEGHSMGAAGIAPGDYLVVDRAIEAAHGHIVVAAVDGDFLVKSLQTHPTLKLIAMSPDYPDIELRSGQELEVFGVVTYVVKPMLSKMP
jgi:DNA polymerase V